MNPVLRVEVEVLAGEGPLEPRWSVVWTVARPDGRKALRSSTGRGETPEEVARVALVDPVLAAELGAVRLGQVIERPIEQDLMRIKWQPFADEEEL